MRRIGTSLSSIVIMLCTVGAGGVGCAASQPERSTARNLKGDGCAPIPDTQLVGLIDDRRLMVADNLVPAIHASAAEPQLTAALNRVMDAFADQATLIRLNKATDLDHKPPRAAAEEFAARAGLTRGLAKGSGRKIAIGSANFNENQTLAHLFRIALTAAGYDATVLPGQPRLEYGPKLIAGEIHVVPEYVGTLTEYLNRQVNGDQASQLAYGDLDRTMESLTGLGSRIGQAKGGPGLVLGTPAAASDQNGFAITKALADRYHIKTMTEFTEECAGKLTVLGGPPECTKEDPFCIGGVERVYGLALGGFVETDAGGEKTRAALRDGRVTIGLLFTSDAVLAG